MARLTDNPILIAKADDLSQTQDVQLLLERNNVDFTLIDPAAFNSRFGVSLLDHYTCPYLVVPGSTEHIDCPTIAQAAQAVGLHSKPSEPTYDLTIIGAGPAGLTAAVYAASEGLSTVVLETCAPGGQAGTSARIENYPGFPGGVSGAELTQQFKQQAEDFGVEFVIGNPPKFAAPDLTTTGRANGPVWVFDDGSILRTRSAIIATGVTYRKLEVPGVAEGVGDYVTYGSDPREHARCKDKDVVIVGGANSCGQAALDIAKYASQVTVIARRPIAETMSEYLVDRIDAADNIEVLIDTEVSKVVKVGTGPEAYIDVHLNHPELAPLIVDHLFVMIGGIPNSNELQHDLQVDNNGYLCTGQDVELFRSTWTANRPALPLETSRPGIFAIGDVRARSVKRVASAVGDGALAIAGVHEFLNTTRK